MLGEGEKSSELQLTLHADPELLQDKLINRLGHVDDFKTTLLRPLHRDGGGGDVLGFSGGVVEGLLGILHPGYVDCERALLVTGSAGVEAGKAGELLTVRRILVDAKFDVLAELLVELLIGDEFLMMKTRWTSSLML